MDELGFIQRCVKGDKEAWDEFVERYSRYIYSYIYTILKQRNIPFEVSLVDDIFQDIFLHLIKDNFKKLSQFKGKSSFSSWLKVVVVNFVCDFLRKNRPFCISLEETLGEDEDFVVKDVLKDNRRPLHDEVILDQENLQILSECIEDLDREDRFFVEMHIYREMKLEALRQILKISRSAVDMRKERLIKKLRDCFKRKGFLSEF
ncbi:MAG: sigma-70 family RNA polymerase sigma factor [Candidatus Omnitrophica bacterium]|nr:sigma-70 family RNA polymerase sigma factor [Candidatus Omnitrophota bacterium]